VEDLKIFLDEVLGSLNHGSRTLLLQTGERSTSVLGCSQGCGLGLQLLINAFLLVVYVVDLAQSGLVEEQHRYDEIKTNKCWYTI
jgi:hypothetical protein